MDCVYWPPSTLDKFGRRAPGTPVQLKCRWDELTETVKDKNGVEFQPKASVMVSEEVDPNGGILMKGTITDIVDADEPLNNDDCWEIRAFENIPNFKCTEFLLVAHLDTGIKV